MYKKCFTDYINKTQLAVFMLTLSRADDDPMQVISVRNIIKNHYHDSALMTAAHILIRLTQQGKSIDQIASEDFDNNLELVSVWADYMVGVNWIYLDGGNKWLPTDAGKIWLQKIVNPYLLDDK
jgi:hypothetical protein